MRLPIARHPARHSPQNVAGQLRHADPGQDQKPAVVDDLSQMGLPLTGCPTNEGIARLGLPSGGAKQDTGQITTLTILHQIAEVLPHRAAVRQIMVPRQIRIEPGRLRLTGIEHLPLQWPQLGQGLRHLDRRGGRQSRQPGRKTWTMAALTGWQPNPTASFELVKKRARGHILDLAGGIVPLPPSAQFQSQTTAAPLRLPGDQTTHLNENLGRDAAALNDGHTNHAFKATARQI